MSAHVRERLGEYLDGEISREERAAMSQHLRECSECRRFLEELGAVDDAARSLPAEAPEGYFDTFAPRVRARLGARSRRSFRPPVWSLALAAALLLAVITPLTLKEHSAPAPTSLDERGAAAPAPRDRPSSPDAEPLGQAVPKPIAPGSVAPAGPIASTLVSASTAKIERLEAPRQGGKDVGEPGRKKEAEPAPSRNVAAATPEQEKAPAPPASTLFRCDGCQPSPSPQIAAEDRVEVKTAAVSAASAEEQPRALAKGRLAPGAVGVDRGSISMDRLSSAGEARYRMLRTRTPATAEEARELRLEWRTFAESTLGRAHADDARVAAIEAAVQAYRFSAAAEDRAAAAADARAYLAHSDAPQAERVRALLETLPDAP